MTMVSDGFKSNSRSAWGWRFPPSEGIWKHGGAKWSKPFVCAVPWIQLCILFFIFSLVASRITLAPGTVFDLPDSGAGQLQVPSLVALVVPVPRENTAAGDELLIFFDDARYTLSDETSMAAFRTRLEQLASEDAAGELLLLADKRVTAGELVHLMSVAKASGIKHVQLAEKRE